MQIFVKLYVGNIITLDVEGPELISEIKKMIQAKGGLSLLTQRLSYCGKTLYDDRTINDYNIKGEATLYEDYMKERRSC